MKTKWPLRKYIYDHWLVLVGFVLGATGISIYLFLKNLFVDFIMWRFSGWIFFGLLVLFLFGVAFYKKTKKQPLPQSGGVRPRPRYKHEDYGEKELAGVNWHLWRGNNMAIDDLLTVEVPRRTWVDGPFCPNCDYELDLNNEGNRWECAECKKKYKIPSELQGDIREKVTKSFEAAIRRGEKRKK